jgi:hypothetical protein
MRKSPLPSSVLPLVADFEEEGGTDPFASRLLENIAPINYN